MKHSNSTYWLSSPEVGIAAEAPDLSENHGASEECTYIQLSAVLQTEEMAANLKRLASEAPA